MASNLLQNSLTNNKWCHNYINFLIRKKGCHIYTTFLIIRTLVIIIPEHLDLEVALDFHRLPLLVNSGGSRSYGLAVPFWVVPSCLVFFCVVWRMTEITFIINQLTYLLTYIHT